MTCFDDFTSDNTFFKSIHKVPHNGLQAYTPNANCGSIKSNSSEAINYFGKIKMSNHEILLDYTAKCCNYGRSLLGSHEGCLVFYGLIFTNKVRL